MSNSEGPMNNGIHKGLARQTRDFSRENVARGRLIIYERGIRLLTKAR